MRNTDAEDALLKAAFTVAGEEEMRRIDEPEAQFSEEHIRRMKQIFAKERKRQRMRKFRKIAGRAAMFFVAAVFAAGASVYSVDAWRVKLLNMIYDRQQTHTEIKFTEETVSSYSVNGITLNYIPEGFKLVADTSELGGRTILDFQDASGNTICFSCSDSSGVHGFDTENADVIYLKYRGYNAVKSLKENVQMLVWYNDTKYYSLECNLGEEELMKIADNIEF